MERRPSRGFYFFCPPWKPVPWLLRRPCPSFPKPASQPRRHQTARYLPSRYKKKEKKNGGPKITWPEKHTRSLLHHHLHHLHQCPPRSPSSPSLFSSSILIFFLLFPTFLYLSLLRLLFRLFLRKCFLISCLIFSIYDSLFFSLFSRMSKRGRGRQGRGVGRVWKMKRLR